MSRKVRMNGGAAFSLLMATMRRDIDHCGAVPTAAGYAAQLEAALRDVEQCTAALQANAPDERTYTANATLYLDMLGHVATAWMWLRQVAVAGRALECDTSAVERQFYEGKLIACRYFYAYELTRLQHWLPLLASAQALPVELDPACL